MTNEQMGFVETMTMVGGFIGGIIFFGVVIVAIIFFIDAAGKI